ncbi:Bud site selection protein 6 [Mortierella sp. GBA30]|nr:Bud site selection protein 6 [Mortierella sp. GBA30]
MESILESRRSFDHTQHIHRSSPKAPSTTRRRKTDHALNPIETTVTNLLVATKQLLESLTLWSNRKLSEEQVSDIFVQLATQFNLASQSFHEAGIDTSDLAHIPDDLRNYLETALGEEPSPASLDRYLPKIKEVIINLLQGLRLKQNIYREHHDAKAVREQTPTPPPTPSSATTPATTPARTRNSGSHMRQPSVGIPQDATDSVGIIGGGLTDYSSSSRMQSLSSGMAPVPMPSFFSPQDESSHAETLATLRKSDTITRRASSRRHSQRFSTLVEQNTTPPMVPRRQHPLSDPNIMITYPGYALNPQNPIPAASPHTTLPYCQLPLLPSLTQEQLLTSPALSTTSSLGYMEVTPLPPTFPMPPLPPVPLVGVQQSPETPIADTQATSSDTDHPPLAAMESITNNGAIEPDSVTNPTSSSTAPEASEIFVSVQPEPVVPDPLESRLTLFLQVGKSVKKTRFEGELTHSGLRMLFMEKFQYNPGQEDFPTIYVKDPHTHIHYELESLADVKENAFLSLNVDDLENIQRKMDQGFAALTKEIHDIKKSQEVSEQARQKAAVAAATAASAVALNNQERAIASTSSGGTQALQSVVQKVLAKSKMMPDTSSCSSSSSSSSSSSPSLTTTGVSSADLKTQHEEIQTLRRDLSVVRQLYTELQTETKSMLGHLAGYTSQIRKQALDAPVSSRLFIESGKIKLDKKSEDLTNKIEELQDIIEDMKVNVTQRRGRPSDVSMAFVYKQCEQVGQDISELSDYIQTLRPSWKKTWEVELQTIVKEQMFLKEQEALLEDLKEDRSSLLQTIGNLRKVMELQVKNGGLGSSKSREYLFQPVIEEGFEGLKTVMEEVKLISPDSNKRLKAMAQMEKLRHIELSNRIDEFEEELTTFVGASKLRKTGGALEAERQRQQRDSENLRAMFAAKASVSTTIDEAE